MKKGQKAILQSSQSQATHELHFGKDAAMHEHNNCRFMTSHSQTLHGNNARKIVDYEKEMHQWQV